MNQIKINDDLMEFLFEDMESDDSIVLENYSINLIKEYLDIATEAEKAEMRNAILEKDAKKVIFLIRNQDKHGNR